MKRQRELIEYLIEKCSSIPEVKALYLKGSIARETSDQFSDVDFYCLVDENFVDEMLDIRMDILHGYRQILYKSHVNFGYPQVVVIYDDNVHLDFYTVHEIPHEGTDSIKVLYDPENKLKDYKIVRNIVEESNLIRILNDVIYTAQEVYAAYGRGDSLWCHRLLSHMITDLGHIFCEKYQPNKPVVHLKGVWLSLPEDTQSEIDSIMSASVPGRYAEATSLILKLCSKVISEEYSEYSNSLHTRYLDYMIEVFDEIQNSELIK